MVCGRCKVTYDRLKRRNGMDVCQACARAIDEDGIENKNTRTSVKTRHASDGSVIQVGKKGRHDETVKVQAFGNSRFENTATCIAKHFQERIDRALKMKPVRQIDPATIECPDRKSVV